MRATPSRSTLCCLITTYPRFKKKSFAVIDACVVILSRPFSISSHSAVATLQRWRSFADVQHIEVRAVYTAKSCDIAVDKSYPRVLICKVLLPSVQAVQVLCPCVELTGGVIARVYNVHCLIKQFCYIFKIFWTVFSQNYFHIFLNIACDFYNCNIFINKVQRI